MPDNLTFCRYDGVGARTVRDTVELIHHEAYAAAIERGDPFESGDAPMDRFDVYVSRAGFDLVVAFLGDEPVGQAWEWALRPDSSWRDGLVGEAEPGFTDEDGTRMFAYSEFMVRARYAGQGIGHALHDELLAPRKERRATLLVRPENTTAYQRYTRWGWRKAAEPPLVESAFLEPPWQRRSHCHVRRIPYRCHREANALFPFASASDRC